MLVRPASESADVFMIEIALLEMLPDPVPRCLMRLRDVTELIARQHTVWSFQSLVRHKFGTSLAQLIAVLQHERRFVNLFLLI